MSSEIHFKRESDPLRREISELKAKIAELAPKQAEASKATPEAGTEAKNPFDPWAPTGMSYSTLSGDTTECRRSGAVVG